MTDTPKLSGPLPRLATAIKKAASGTFVLSELDKSKRNARHDVDERLPALGFPVVNAGSRSSTGRGRREALYKANIGAWLTTLGISQADAAWLAALAHERGLSLAQLLGQMAGALRAIEEAGIVLGEE